MRPQLIVSVNPRNPIGSYRRVDLSATNRILHSDDEHSGTRLGQPSTRIELKGIDRITKSIEFLDNHAEIASSMRRSQSANVLENNRLRSSGAHLLHYADESEESFGLRSSRKPAKERSVHGLEAQAISAEGTLSASTSKTSPNSRWSSPH